MDFWERSTSPSCMESESGCSRRMKFISPGVPWERREADNYIISTLGCWRLAGQITIRNSDTCLIHFSHVSIRYRGGLINLQSRGKYSFMFNNIITQYHSCNVKQLNSRKGVRVERIRRCQKGSEFKKKYFLFLKCFNYFSRNTNKEKFFIF